MRSKIELHPPKLVEYLLNKRSRFVDGIYRVAQTVEPMLEAISKTFPTYTLHNIDHSIRIMRYMYELIEDIEQLSELEITLLIYAALLHDIGMFATDEEIELVKNNQYQHSDLKYKAILRKFDGNESEALQEFLRRIHSERSAEFIMNHLSKEFCLPENQSISYVDELCKICVSHTKDIQWVTSNLKNKSIKGVYELNSQYCAALLRMGDILDIDPERTPYLLYKLINPQGVSKTEWKQHFEISNFEKISQDEKTGQKKITLYGNCNDAAIHRKLLRYIGWINDEINNVTKITLDMPDKYRLDIRYPVGNLVESIGYSISDLKLTLDYKAVTELLMGEKIYGEKLLGLRELVQNSIDACRVKYEIRKNHIDNLLSEYTPTIMILANRGKGELVIKDNGIGMSFDILRKYFLSIGVSYYRSDDFLLKDFNYKPIGNFGIGFLACFMLSKEVKIRTRHIDSSTKYEVSLSKDSEFVCISESDDPSFEGTEVILDYDEFMSIAGSKEKIISFIENNFVTENIKVKYVEYNDSSTKVNEVVNPLQTPSKSSGSLEIDLSRFLIDVVGSVRINVKKKFIGHSLEDIPYRGKPYYFDGDILSEMDPETFDMDKLYNNYSIRYLSAPLIDRTMSSEYDRIFDVLEDEEETINKIKDEANWITIFLDKSIVEKIRDEIVFEGDSFLFDTLDYDHLVEMGHEDDYPTKIHAHEFPLIFDNRNICFLPITVIDSELNDILSNYLPHVLERTRRLFVRDVFVRDHHFVTPTISSSIDIESINVNVTNQSIIPDISRNRLEKDAGLELNYAINKAIHLWVIDNLSLDIREKKLLEEFIDIFYFKESYLLKGQNQD